MRKYKKPPAIPDPLPPGQWSPPMTDDTVKPKYKKPVASSEYQKLEAVALLVLNLLPSYESVGNIRNHLIGKFNRESKRLKIK